MIYLGIVIMTAVISSLLTLATLASSGYKVPQEYHHVAYLMTIFALGLLFFVIGVSYK